MNAERALEKSLFCAGINKSAKDYVRESAKKALAISLASTCFLLLAGIELPHAMIALLAILAIAFLAILQSPRALARKKALLVEKDLPFALMSMGVELNLGIPFEKALANRADNSSLGSELQKAIKEIKERGTSVQEALANISKRVDSPETKRAMAQLTSAYEEGREKQGETITSFAREMLSKQRSQAKAFSGKLAMMSLFFIVVSAIIPVMLLTAISVGSMFLEINVSGETVLVAFTVILPLIDLALLLLIRENTPIFMRD